MEEKPGTSIQITPEMLQALTQQLLAVQQQNTTSTTQTTSQTVNFGNYKLTPFSPNSPNSFKAKAAVTSRQQVLLDYAWNARNRAQLTVALQALATYFNEVNTQVTQKPLVLQPPMEKFEPGVPSSKLVSIIKELEVENTFLQREVIEKEKITRELRTLKDYIHEEEKIKVEGWGMWKRFPEKINPCKEEVLDIVLSDHMGEQIYFQQMFRRMASKKQLFRGMTFQSETYEDDKNQCKGFSYITCSINLGVWKEVNLEGQKIKLQRLLQLGLIQKLIITKKSQLKDIDLEKLVLVLSDLFEENPQAQYEAEFQTIPPSFYPRHLDDTRSFITIRRIHCATQAYSIIPQESLVSEEKVELLDQINMYRALVYRKPYIIPPKFELVAEDKCSKIYSNKWNKMRDVTISFSALTTEFPEEVIYFNKIKAYHMTRREGDLTSGIYFNEEIESSKGDEEMEDQDPTYSFDSDAQKNLDNTAE